MDILSNAVPGANGVAGVGKFTIGFDFSGPDQMRNLRYLQQNGYRLCIYKGASGRGQFTDGLPTWFTIPLVELSGIVEIDYMPKYKVYIFNQPAIAVNTVISMHALSEEVSLGTSLTYGGNGSFRLSSRSARPDSIQIENENLNNNVITIGLAALINGKYAPFCAFTLSSRASISITPNEKICIFATHSTLPRGLVVARASAPGCTFSFSASASNYKLLVTDGSYGLTNVNGTPQVTPSNPEELLNYLLNS